MVIYKRAYIYGKNATDNLNTALNEALNGIRKEESQIDYLERITRLELIVYRAERLCRVIEKRGSIIERAALKLGRISNLEKYLFNKRILKIEK